MTDVRIGRVAGGSADLRGYLAVPDGPGPWPGVVAIHEAFGVDPVMRRQADRLASAGYLTLLLDLYSDGGPARCLLGTVRALLSGAGKPFADIDAARGWLQDRSDCTGKIGLIGFCMGGAFALVTADRGFDAASVNYGPLPPHVERHLSGACPIVASYGKKDVSTRGAAGKIERELTKAGVPHDVKLYPNAGHSFLNDAMTGPRPLRPLLKVTGFRPEPETAKDAWRRIEDFFATHLGEAAAAG
jgi:carboxymethylenebutenolidase